MTEGSEEGGAPAASTLPGAEGASADPRKFTEYLLSSEHPVGRAKARFFAGVGFSTANWTELESQIMAQLPTATARFSKRSEIDTELYEVPLTITGPDGTATADIQTIWQVRPDEGTTFVTAYPL